MPYFNWMALQLERGRQQILNRPPRRGGFLLYSLLLSKLEEKTDYEDLAFARSHGKAGNFYGLKGKEDSGNRRIFGLLSNP